MDLHLAGQASRFTTPDEVAALGVMVASDRIGNVAGAGVIIDGGLVSTL